MESGRRAPTPAGSAERATDRAVGSIAESKELHTMRIEDYESPAIADASAPRRNASQLAAAKHRDRITEPLTPLAPVRNPIPANYLPLAIGALVLVLAMIGMVTWQLSHPLRPMAIQTAPTAAPTYAPTAAPTYAPTAAPTYAPTAAPTYAPTAAPAAPAAAPAEHLPEQPVGRGLTLADTPEPADTPELAAVFVPTAEPAMLEIIGAQAEHSPRGGLCGPTSGDCAPGVPAGIDSSQYIANVGAQAPHKVR